MIHKKPRSPSCASDRELLFTGPGSEIHSDGEEHIFRDAVPNKKILWYHLHSPSDVIAVIYLASSLWPYFVYPLAHPLWMLIHFTYMTLLITAPLFIYRDRERGTYRHWLLRLVMDYHALLFFSIFYSELGHIIVLVGAEFRDYVVQAYEEDVFGLFLCRELHNMFPSRILGEYFCICYLGYFLFIFLLIAVVGFTRSQRDLHTVTGTLVFCFAVNFVVFTYFPVEGPFWQIARVNPNEIGYSVCLLVHSVLSGGSAHGTAFPSSHVGISITVWTLAMRYSRKLACFYVLVIPGLCIATVYGGFHYGVDAICGFVFGLVWSSVGHFVSGLLLPHTCVGRIAVNTNAASACG